MSEPSLHLWPSRPLARLPEAIRHQINRMLDDGLPYRAILHKLQASSAVPLPYALSEMNLSNWRRGGYQEWRRHQDNQELLASLKAAALKDRSEPFRTVLQQFEPIKA